MIYQILTLIIASALGCMAYYLLCKVHQQEEIILDKCEDNDRLTEKITDLCADIRKQKAELKDKDRCIAEANKSTNELLGLNHQLATGIVQADTLRIEAQNQLSIVQNELTRLHQRYYNQVPKSPLDKVVLSKN